MELTAKSLDETTTELVDYFDDLIAPKYVHRGNTNKLYLILRACARGLKTLRDAALALKHRFNPLYCSSEDLYSVSKLVGTDFKKGSGSILEITIRNGDLESVHNLAAGVYVYTSVSGMAFSFEITNDYLFAGGEYRTVSAISREKGSFRVEDNANIRLTRADGVAIDSGFRFSCVDNILQLGYEDESETGFRSRIMNDADRQDHLRELELKIRNLPNIFECSLVFNPGVTELGYDGVILAPLELLVIITGVPTNEVARLVAEAVHYQTHMVDPAKVVYYECPLYIDGRYPVYYTSHGTTDFSLEILYQYDEQKLKAVQVEDAVRLLLDPYTHADTSIDRISEGDIYQVLSALRLPNVKVLDVRLMVDGMAVPYLTVPRTRLPRLTGVIFGTPENPEAAP